MAFCPPCTGQSTLEHTAYRPSVDKQTNIFLKGLINKRPERCQYLKGTVHFKNAYFLYPLHVPTAGLIQDYLILSYIRAIMNCVVNTI